MICEAAMHAVQTCILGRRDDSACDLAQIQRHRKDAQLQLVVIEVHSWSLNLCSHRSCVEVASHWRMSG